MLEPEKQQSGIFSKFRQSLTKSRNAIRDKLGNVFKRNVLDEQFWEEVEDVLVSSDMGVATTLEIVESVKEKIKLISNFEIENIWAVLKEELNGKLISKPGILLSEKPLVVLVVGVNGSGKTTTTGKLAKHEMKKSKKVLLSAGDTYRAAAVEQLDIVANKINAPIVRSHRGADPSAVAYDSVDALINRGMDILFIDTAGRLQTHQNLMAELSKIKKITLRQAGDRAEVVSLLVLDATTGQNGIAQARAFHEAVSIDAVVLTKLDGTAKGGIVFAICNELKLPIAYIGTGESMDDIEQFDPAKFTDALIE
jgi:fused signal recognition particle receptor